MHEEALEDEEDNGGVIGGGPSVEVVEVVQVEKVAFFLLMVVDGWCLWMVGNFDILACFRNRSFCFRNSLIWLT